MREITPDGPDDGSGPATAKSDDPDRLLLHRETAVVAKRTRRTLVRASRKTANRDETIITDLAHEHVVVERVAVGRVVDCIPPVRQEGDVTIMPVVVEEVVVTKRLVLQEEVHLRRVRGKTSRSETVTLREQRVVVTRTELDD